MSKKHSFLFYFLAGGGLRNMGKTEMQEQAKSRHRAFLYIAGGIFVIWAILYFV